MMKFEFSKMLHSVIDSSHSPASGRQRNTQLLLRMLKVSNTVIKYDVIELYKHRMKSDVIVHMAIPIFSVLHVEHHNENWFFG